MTTKSINDRLGDGGLDSVAVFRESTPGIVDAFISPTSTVLKIPMLVSQQYTAVSRLSQNTIIAPNDDTAYVTIATATLPGGTMGLHSKLVIIPDWDYPASASRKLMAVDFGASNISAVDIDGASLPTYRMGKILLELQNLGSLSVQKTMNGSSYGVSPNPRVSSAIDTSQDVTISFKCKWNAATLSETITLLGYSIWHWPGND